MDASWLDGRRASVRKPTSVALRCVAGFRPKFPFELRHSVLGVAAPEMDSEGWPRKAGALHLHAIG